MKIEDLENYETVAKVFLELIKNRNETIKSLDELDLVRDGKSNPYFMEFCEVVTETFENMSEEINKISDKVNIMWEDYQKNKNISINNILDSFN